MGNVGSRPDDGSAIFLKDQNRFAISSLVITNSRRKTVLQISPNAFPARQLVAKRETGDDNPVEFIQDPEPPSAAAGPSFLLRLNNEDELTFHFTMVIRQSPATPGGAIAGQDATINGLTFVFASNNKELDTLVTREFHSDPNLHKNSNVELVGQEFSTGGSPSVSLEYTWKWRPPKPTEDRGGGWRNSCTFVEYDQRAHRLNTLATFAFWVQKTRPMTAPLPSPQEYMVVPRIRVASTQSVQTILSDSEGFSEKEMPSPTPGDEFPPGSAPIPVPAPAIGQAVIDVSCARPTEDLSAVEDGPLFRATIKALEQKTGNMRARMKKVLKKAEAAQIAQLQCNEAMADFQGALKEASISNANAVQPALEHYFDKIAREILVYEQQMGINLQRLIIEPMARLYNVDIKQADNKKREFEDESKEYYAYMSRYLGQRQDSLKEKKRVESDSKTQSKRRTFELKRFDYSSFMQDLHGGRKEQEVLSHLTKFADSQTKAYLATAKKVAEMLPQLDALVREVGDTDKEYKIQRTEREEKRRNLEKNAKSPVESDAPPLTSISAASGTTLANSTISDADLARADSVGRGNLHHSASVASQASVTSTVASIGLTPSTSIRSSVGGSPVGSPGQERFKGIRDLEDKAPSMSTSLAEQSAGAQRKEGLLWAMSRPASHVDPRTLNKINWHKFWIVLDQGKLSEYSNWKDRLDLHMDPIDLRLASVREARNSERRFCFEVITPNFRRIYQATSEDDMTNWINAINNALQGAFEGRGQQHPSYDMVSPTGNSFRRDIGSVLTGKTSLHGREPSHSSQANGNQANVHRRITVGSRPSYIQTNSNSYNEDPTKLLQEIRERDQGNLWCADCNSNVKTEWVSINLGIILCIECSGIHRSLGTHISKVRSLTLDTSAFTADIVEIIMLVGNRLSNQIWEARLDQSMKPPPTATRDQRLRFITDKYVDRLFVAPISTTLSPYGTPDDTLIASVKKNDIQQVLYALALKANPNAADKSRNTHVVFLALAAADPAVPSGSISPGISPRATSSPSVPSKSPSFPVAELLLQNGGELPSTLPAFPLSANVQTYIEQRSSKLYTSDTLGALPTIGGKPSLAGPPQTSTSTSSLQKRTSAGARFGGNRLGL